MRIPIRDFNKKPHEGKSEPYLLKINNSLDPRNKEFQLLKD